MLEDLEKAIAEIVLMVAPGLEDVEHGAIFGQ